MTLLWLTPEWFPVATSLRGLWTWTIPDAEQTALRAARDAGAAVTVQRREGDGEYTLLAAVAPVVRKRFT